MFISSEHSDEDMEVYARSVDLPGFDDNVSPSNNINTLLRFIVGEFIKITQKSYILIAIVNKKTESVEYLPIFRFLSHVLSKKYCRSHILFARTTFYT